MEKRLTHNGVLPDSMSLEEARSVMWLRSDYRSLGELLDSGYLNRRRLEWASQKAYDPELRLAAAVLLDWLENNPSNSAASKPSVETSTTSVLPVLDLPMTVEQARAMMWPFGSTKGQPMGSLVDTKQLTLKDLGYAIENAWERQVRQAAVVLMALRLRQAVTEPSSAVGLIRVVSAGRSFAQRREYRLTLVQGMIFGVVFWTALLFLVWLIARPRPGTLSPSKPLSELVASPANIVALLAVLAIVAGAIWLLLYLFEQAIERLEKQIESYRKGQEGEQKVVEVMHQALDGSWTLFRNIVLPGRNKADFDVILVGPLGVWVLEVKNFAGSYRNIGEHWEYRAGKRWKPLKSSPTHQARDNAVRLADFLRADGIRQWVTPVVVWADQGSSLVLENPSIAVWPIDRLSDELGNIWQGQTIPESDQARITDKLTTLCQRSKSAQAS